VKKIVCELCESTNLIKQNGMFVCQNCGTKYSLEDARKMMVDVDDSEISTDAIAVPAVKDNPQVLNLLELARVSLSSNNNAEAEKFCNQVIAIDAQNFEAWKMKGDAVAPQNTTDTPRALEVYNCYITAYRVLPQEEKAGHKREIIDAIKNCLLQNVLMWLAEVEAKRPTESQVKIAEDAFADAYSKLMSAYNEVGITEGREAELNLFENAFIMAVNTLCVSAWNSTVGYNYYRQDLATFGLLWNKKGRDYSTDFRPMTEIFSTFIDETGHLVDLLKYAENQFNADTDAQTKINVYNNIAFLVRAPKDCCSFKPMVETTTNGYGAVVGRTEYWEVDKTLTDTAKMLRETEASGYEEKAKQIENRMKQEAKDKYWAEHSEEKESLEKERKELVEKVDRLTEIIASLGAKKSSLGMFKGKEKRELQDKIDKKQEERDASKTRIKEIDDELNKER